MFACTKLLRIFEDLGFSLIIMLPSFAQENLKKDALYPMKGTFCDINNTHSHMLC